MNKYLISGLLALAFAAPAHAQFMPLISLPYHVDIDADGQRCGNGQHVGDPMYNVQQCLHWNRIGMCDTENSYVAYPRNDGECFIPGSQTLLHVNVDPENKELDVRIGNEGTDRIPITSMPGVIRRSYNGHDFTFTISHGWPGTNNGPIANNPGAMR